MNSLNLNPTNRRTVKEKNDQVQQLPNHLTDFNQNLDIYFPQWGHQLIRFSESWVWTFTDIFPGKGILIDGLGRQVLKYKSHFDVRHAYVMSSYTGATN